MTSINSNYHSIHSVLKEVWKYDTFRPRQERIINSILDKRETIGLLPTGGGKSLCFQIPALMMKDYTIVVSPLIALMSDQVDSLKKRGIEAEGINHMMSSEEIDKVYTNCVQGKIKLLYVSPERLNTRKFISLIKQKTPAMLIVDEAHCISQWGHDFRPSYLEICTVKKHVPGMKIHAFTATADQKVLSDIKKYLELNNPTVVRKSYRRQNLAFRVYYSENKLVSLVHFLKEFEGVGIIYVRSRVRTERIADFLRKSGFDAVHYHAGMPSAKRISIQDVFMTSEKQIIVSTNAFGMGVDKSNVRFVVHMDLPENLESYYQEAGRAGRDGIDSIALTLYNQRDIKQLQERFQLNFLPLKRLKSLYMSLLKKAKKHDFEIDVDDSLIERFEEQGYSNREFRKAVEVLKRMDLIDYDDNINWQSSIEIHRVGRSPKSLSPDLAEVLMAIKRVYNKKDQAFSISESDLSEYLQLTKGQVITQLVKLHDLGILTYNGRSIYGKIFILDEPRPSRSFKIYNKLRKVKEKKLAHMQAFIEEPMCRQLYILRYFGEGSMRKCKKCDICLKSSKGRYSNKELKSFNATLMDNIPEDGIDIDLLMKNFPFFEQEKYREMIKTLYYDGDLMIKGKRVHYIG